MGARGRARDGLTAGRGGGELHQHLQPGSRRDLRRRHAGGGQAVPSAAQRGQAARIQARVGSLSHRAGHAAGHRRRFRGRCGVYPETVGAALKRLGVIGSMVWDTIHGRDPAQAAVEEWGGIAYALAALDATLPDDWEIVPLIKVGRDLAPKANDFLRSLRHTPHAARFIEVPEPNNRVTLRYESVERRCEQMTGGVPLAIAADALRQGCSTLCVTLGKRGAAYFTGTPVRTELIPAPAIHQSPFLQESDPTGCGDVFGGTVAATLLGGASLEEALRAGTMLGARNLTHRGATGLRDHLMGKLSIA